MTGGSNFLTMTHGLFHPSTGRPLTRMEAAKKIFYHGVPQSAAYFHQKCVQRLKEFYETKELDRQPPKKKLDLKHPSFMAAKLRLSLGSIRRLRLIEIQNQALIAGQVNAIDGLRLQTFMDCDFKPPVIPRSITMTPSEIALLEKLIRETSCRHVEKRT